MQLVIWRLYGALGICRTQCKLITLNSTKQQCKVSVQILCTCTELINAHSPFKALQCFWLQKIINSYKPDFSDCRKSLILTNLVFNWIVKSSHAKVFLRDLNQSDEWLLKKIMTLLPSLHLLPLEILPPSSFSVPLYLKTQYSSPSQFK